MPSLYCSTVKSGNTAIIMSVADSRRQPDGVPYGGSVTTEPGTRSITPPIGSAVVLSICARSRAAWLTHRLWWPSDQSDIGLAVSPSRSALSGPMPGYAASLQPLPW